MVYTCVIVYFDIHVCGCHKCVVFKCLYLAKWVTSNLLTQALLLSEKNQQEELLQRVSFLDQQLQAQSEALAEVTASKDELHLELEKEAEEKKKLVQQVN